MGKVIVRLVSAAWCKRCHTLKPDIRALCAATGAQFEEVDYDALDDDDPQKTAIKSLPTIQMSTDSATTWRAYTATTLEEWKTAIMASAELSTQDTDF